jgi:hypothetical protein
MEINNFWKLETDKMKVSDVEIVEINELIKTIKPLRFERYKTSDILHKFFESKVKKEGHSIENGKEITFDILDPDTTIHDHYVIILYDYFHNLYEDKKGETISFAYAYEYICQIYNRLDINKFDPQPLPNTNPNDIEKAINLENKEKQDNNIKNYNSMINDLGVKESIRKYYTDLCKRLDIERLFSILLPYNNIYMLSNYSKFLANSVFESEEEAKKEKKRYCDWFLEAVLKLLYNFSKHDLAESNL